MQAKNWKIVGQIQKQRKIPRLDDRGDGKSMSRRKDKDKDIEFEAWLCKATLYKKIRTIAGASWPYRVEIVPGNLAPTIRRDDECERWEWGEYVVLGTGGTSSAQRIDVGYEWIVQHATDEEITSLMIIRFERGKDGRS